MKASFRIVFMYIVAASLWIILSDKAASVMAVDIQSFTWFATVKGLAFVAVTAALLFLLIRREINAKNAVIEELKTSIRQREDMADELHHRIKNNLQVVKSLIALEAEGKGSKEELVSTIMEEIQAISAVFEIVYEKRSMSNIPLHEAIDRFVARKRTGISSIAIETDILEGIAYQLETTTSVILLLNVVIDSAAKQGSPDSRLRISVRDPKKIELSCEKIRCDGCLDQISSNQLVEAYLRTFNGSLSTTGDTIVIDVGK